MSKQPISAAEAEDLPPPYTPSASETISPPAAVSSGSLLFTSQLSSLRHQIHNQQATRASAREEQDNYVLGLIVPYIEDFISSIATYDPTPLAVEAILLPSDSVSHEWHLSDEQERRPGEHVEVVFIQRHDKLRSDAKEGSSFKSDASSGLWWADEAMARRLARYLQPEKAVPERASVTPPTPAAKDKRPSRWKLFGKGKEVEPQPSSASASIPNPPAEEDVIMTARAEEVTFRRENEFGIWESSSGWAIIVRVKLLRT